LSASQARELDRMEKQNQAAPRDHRRRPGAGKPTAQRGSVA